MNYEMIDTAIGLWYIIDRKKHQVICYICSDFCMPLHARYSEDSGGWAHDSCLEWEL